MEWQPITTWRRNATFGTLAALIALAGCANVGTVTPAGLRAGAKPVPFDGVGERDKVALCLLHGLEANAQPVGIQANMRPSADGSATEVIGVVNGDAMIALDVTQAADRRVRVLYYLEPGLIFKGILDSRVRKAIAGCVV